MALHREDIERDDFPVARRGYDPAAVAAHLARVADRIDALEREARPGLGAAASAQVQAILEAAEQSAATIERDARAEAQRIVEESRAGMHRADSEAVERSREHVARVEAQSAAMVERIEALEAEAAAVLDALRTGARRLRADLQHLEADMGALYGAAAGPEAAVREPEPEPVPEPERARVVAMAPAEPDPEPEPPARARAAAPAPDADDLEGARLVALDMALNGQPREETDRYLAEHYALADRDALLDEVYASVG